jgi:hypothetical protein
MALFKKISELLESTELGFVIETVGGVSKKFNLGNLGKKTQYETLPSASENAGKIFQYIGETNENYTNGMFYVSLENGQGQYEWFPSSIMQKVDNATTGDIATLDESGNVTDSGIAASNVIQKVSGSTNGNFAGLDANGNLTDSGNKASDFKTVQTAVLDPTASGTSTTAITNITQDANGVIVPTKKTIVDTKNTAGSTDSSSKLFLVGATSQADNPQTYSDDEVYTTGGVLTTKSVQVGGGAATIQWNSNNNAIDFNFL